MKRTFILLAIFVAACGVMVANDLWRNPGTSAAGLAIIAAGLPVYFWMRSSRSTGTKSLSSP